MPATPKRFDRTGLHRGAALSDGDFDPSVLDGQGVGAKCALLRWFAQISTRASEALVIGVGPVGLIVTLSLDHHDAQARLVDGRGRRPLRGYACGLQVRRRHVCCSSDSPSSQQGKQSIMSSHPATLAQMMGPSLITIGSDASVAQALQLARSNQIHHLPVLSGSELVGLMCTCDVRGAAPESLVAQRMSQPAVTLDASATLHTAAKTMQDQRVGSVIVTVEGQPRGIVTRGDLLRVEPSTEDILWNGRCECCGLTRHLSTGPDGRTLCMYCSDDPPETQRSQWAPQPDVGFEFSPSPTPDPRPLDSLIREHRLIGKLAQALSNFSECFASQPTPHDRDDLAKFSRVFRDLGDCMHHEKEETVLLPLLAHLGFDWEDGPLAEVRQEHCQERYLINVLCQAAEREGDWSEHERRRVCATASALAEFQRTHLHKENTELFPVILQRMSAKEQRLLESELHIFDLRMDRHMPRAELTALAEDLIQRYLPPLLADSTVVQCGLSALVIG